jgi:ribosomal protein S18 acetylase RimI-like enzyme
MNVVIKVAAQDQVDKVLSTTLLAFSSDPFVRWAINDSHQYLTRYAQLFKVSINTAISHNAAYFSVGFSGTAVWFPPSVYAEDQHILSAIKDLGPCSLKELMVESFEKFLLYHPQEPHLYMPFMGVDPNFQGQGIGSSLLRHSLQECDRTQHMA